eukprot:232345_1
MGSSFSSWFANDGDLIVSDPLNFIIRKADDILVVNAQSFKYAPTQTIIAFTKISDVSEIDVVSQSGNMPHFGLLFRNQFIVSTNPSKRYQYLLCHALRHRDDHSKLKVDIIITNHIDTAKARLAGLVGRDASDVQCSTWERVSQTATMQVIVSAFHKIIQNTFDSHCAKQMAKSTYDDKVNCVLAAKYFYGVLMDINSDQYIEEWINEHRGRLFKAAELNPNDEEIPCKGGDVFWNTLKAKYTVEGVYRIQERKTEDEIKQIMEMGIDFEPDAVVHDKKYRVIFQAKGTKKDIGYDWKDIFRSNEKEEAFGIYNEKPEAVEEFKQQTVDPGSFKSRNHCPTCDVHHVRCFGCHRVQCPKCKIWWCNLCGTQLGRDWQSHFKQPNKCVLHSKKKGK